MGRLRTNDVSSSDPFKKKTENCPSIRSLIKPDNRKKCLMYCFYSVVPPSNLVRFLFVIHETSTFSFSNLKVAILLQVLRIRRST